MDKQKIRTNYTSVGRDYYGRDVTIDHIDHYLFGENKYLGDLILWFFLSSAYVVSTGPTSRNSVFLCIFHTFGTNFFGDGSGVPLIQDIVNSNARTWLSMSSTKLRFFSLAEQCHTQIF